jgi:hypothetical protein
MSPLELWWLGLNVVPVPRPWGGHDGKRPAIPWKRWQTERVPFELACRWFVGYDTNTAVITGAVSGVVVVDADSDEAIAWCSENLPKTPWLVRTRKGFHMYFLHPGVPVGNRCKIETGQGKLAIDVRGDGGYVIAIGSVHESGSRYLEAGDWSVPKWQLPVFPVELLEKAAPVERSGKVVHCKRDPYDIYIGRPGPWGNPFPLKSEAGRQDCLAQYEAWIRTQPALIAKVRELRGKALGCWCAPRPCHGDVLLRLANEPLLKAPGVPQERAERYLRRIPPPVEGCGSDHATYVAACRLVRGFALEQEAAIDLLVKWTGFDEWWVRQKVTSAVSNGKQRIGGML